MTNPYTCDSCENCDDCSEIESQAVRDVAVRCGLTCHSNFDKEELKERYEYPEKHPKRCDNCKREKTTDYDWDNDGRKWEVIHCPAGSITYEFGVRDFIDEVGCPLFQG